MNLVLKLEVETNMFNRLHYKSSFHFAERLFCISVFRRKSERFENKSTAPR